MAAQAVVISQGTFGCLRELSGSSRQSSSLSVGVCRSGSRFATFKGLRSSGVAQQRADVQRSRRNGLRGAVCSADLEERQRNTSSKVSLFVEPQELSGAQKLVQPLTAPLRYAVCAGLIVASLGTGYAVGGKIAVPAGKLAGAVVLGGVGAVAAHLVNNAGKQVAAVELHNRVAQSDDPLNIRRKDVEEIATRYGVDPNDGPFNDELKDLYARFVQSVIPSGEEPLRGNEADAITKFKNALGLQDPEAASAHIEVGRRIFRQRLEVGDKDMQANERRTFQKLVYVSTLVFGDAHTFLLPWKRVFKVTDSQIDVAIRENAQTLFQSQVEESAADPDVGRLQYLREVMVSLRLLPEVAAEHFRARARKRVEGHLTRALDLVRLRNRNKDMSGLVTELDAALAYSNSLAALAQRPDASTLVPGVAAVTLEGGVYDVDRGIDDLKLLYKTYLTETLAEDRVSDQKVHTLASLRGLFGLGKREAEAITTEVTARVYRRKLSALATAGGVLDSAPSKAAVLEDLCDQLQFDPDQASTVHADIYRQKLEQCLEDNKLSDEDIAALLRLRVLLCIPQKSVDAAHEELCGRLYSKVVDDAIAAGVEGYDATMKKKVRETREYLRLTMDSALGIASKAVRAVFLTYIKRSKSTPNRAEGARELKKMVLFSNLVVSDLINDIKGLSPAPTKAAKSEEDLKRDEERRKMEEEMGEMASLQSMRKVQGTKEVVDAGKSQKDITLAGDLELRERTDVYRNFLLYCLSGETTNAAFGAMIVTQKDTSDFVRLGQLGDILGLSPVEVASVHKGLAEQAFESSAKTLLADGQLTPNRMEQLKVMQKQLGLPEESAQKVIKSITATRMAGQIDSAVAQGKMTVEDIRQLREAGVDIESMVNKTARMNMFRKLVDKALSTGTGKLAAEDLYEKLPDDLGLERKRVKDAVDEIAEEKCRMSLVQAAAALRQKRVDEVEACLNNVLACDKAKPVEGKLKWAVREELFDLYAIYASRSSADEAGRLRLCELLDIDEDTARRLESGERLPVVVAEEEEEFAF